MRGKQESLEIVERALLACRAGGAQVVLRSRRLETTTYADNHVEQDKSESSESVYMRVRHAGREAWGVTHQCDDASLARLVDELTRAALDSSSEHPLPSLPGPQQYPETQPYVPLTALWTREQRAEAVALMVEQARGNGLVAYGMYRTAVRQVAMGNTSGLRAFESRTDAEINAVVHGPGGSGYGDAYARDVAQLSPLDVVEQAISKALTSAAPTAIEPGEYEVVLEQNAVADLIRCLRPGFSARAVRKGHSALSGKRDHKVTGPLVTLTDDGPFADGLHSSFDFEGMPRQRVALLSEGVEAGLVHDTRTAAIAGMGSTGHAAEPAGEQASDPVASSIFMEHGEAELENMIGAVRRGLLISRLSHLRVVDPREALVHGETQHGTFLIEDGVLSRAVGNLRFEERLLDALRGIEQITRERKLVVDDAGGEPRCIIAPALLLHRFRFVGLEGA